ncbi:siroheme synthase [Ignicoccus pacificus DSM 13166]|uniref:precorrin-2 dehydrogenase n=1 Tax=Ignicoccus pacificus DSM 13166 TaxID=940294 RepID=A0A977KAK5_9CREN|nr:siroheme synthase [Ignicoccus pacificus DSM 13166]
MKRVPLFLSLEGRKVVVFGGGHVGTRRAKKFKEAGAKVTVVAKDFSEELKSLDGVELVKADLRDEKTIEELINGAFLVVIATSVPEINDKIFSVAKKMGILVNDATNANRSDVHVPFESEVEGIRIAISSEGASGVSAHIAQYLIEECLKRNTFWKNINRFAKLFKKELKNRIKDAKDRYHLYWYVMLNDDVIRFIKEGRIEDALYKAIEIATKEAGIRGYEPSKAMPLFLSKWGDELLLSCCSPFEDRSR